VKALPARAAVLSAALALAILPTTALATSPINASAVDNGQNYLRTQQAADGSITGFSGVSAWAAMAFDAAGIDPSTIENGGPTLIEYLQSQHPAAGASATEWERDILAITAAGQNPYSFGGVNYVAGLKALHHDSQIGSTSAVNDDFFGVAALVAAHQPITDPSLADALAFTLAHQHADGGFSYSTDASVASDVDDTAAAIMALVAAGKAGLTVPAASLTNAKNFMLGAQNSDGGFPYDPTSQPDSNASTTSWALMALTALGSGGTTKAHHAAHYLRDVQNADGSFPYQSGPGDTFDTAYGVMALSDGFWPLHVYDGTVPADPVDPAAGSVLGASTTGGSGAGGSGAATLPAVGNSAKGALPALGFVAAFMALTALAAFLPRRRARQQA
jgi:prenyltransferase beta subunit